MVYRCVSHAHVRVCEGWWYRHRCGARYAGHIRMQANSHMTKLQKICGQSVKVRASVWRVVAPCLPPYPPSYLPRVFQGLMQLGADWEKHRRPLVNKLRTLKVSSSCHRQPHRPPHDRAVYAYVHARARQESIAQRKAACKHKVSGWWCDRCVRLLWYSSAGLCFAQPLRCCRLTR